jgi:uncharacterized membrane protein SirB2
VEGSVTARSRIAAGLVAGICGGIVMDLFLFAVQIAAGTPPAVAVVLTWSGLAAVLVGSGIATNPAAPALGAALHFALAIGWALGYVSLARTRPQLVSRPWISGAAFGLVVYVFMEIVFITAGQYRRPTPAAFATALVAYIVAYGIPVGLTAARMLRPSTSSG